ncbi:MAG: competence/damage-inducible protein A [Phycisphaerae bacterium]|nr:competence/damage-inducible protein A [Phycisphaerae bacterium]
MGRVFLLSIGNELLSGRTVDTNAAWISGQLAERGIPTVGILTVPDEIADTVESLRLAVSKSDIVIVTGGLGPTDDDLTRQSLAQYLGVELQFHPELFESIAAFFRRRNFTMVDKNRIQAYLPIGTEAISNSSGTAPGIFARKDHARIFCLPGVPSEMKIMFNDFVLPRIIHSAGRQFVISRRLKCFGTGESMIAEKIGDMMLRGRNPLINCTVSDGVITLHIVATAPDSSVAETLIRKDQTVLCEMLGDWVYGTDDQTLAEVVGYHLARTGKTIAVAESCTGGLIAKMLTDIPGSSRYFAYGWVTYGNQAKQSELGVDPALLNKYGAVSEPVVRAMAEGALRKSGADFAVAVSGIAGPEGGTEQKPVGLVYIGVATPDQTMVHESRFSNSRPVIRHRAALTALNLIRLQIRG